MVLPNWDALPVRTKRSRKRLYALLASELSLTAWKSLPYNVKRSKKHLYNYIASAKNLEEYDELAKNNMRSTRLLYTYIKDNASGSKPTLTIKVKDGDSNVSGATVTIGSTEKTTDASGETTYSLDYDNYTVEVEKSGYIDYSENIKFRANHKTFTIPLEAVTYKVTVTAKDSEAAALNGATVNIKADTTTVATGLTGTDGKVELTGVRAGTYTLEAESSDETLSYTGSLVVDGDEEENITLTIPVTTGTVTVTCTDSSNQKLVGANVSLWANNPPQSLADVICGGPTGSDGSIVLCEMNEQGEPTQTPADVPFGTYYLVAVSSDETLSYLDEFTVDGDETVTIILISGGK